MAILRTVTASSVILGVLAVSGLAVGVAGVASAAPTGGSSSCQRLQGLTDADLCVSVQPTASSVRPGAAVNYVVGVSVEGGSTADVTVSLSGSGAVYTSGCPAGNGTARCWIVTMGLLGSPSSYQMDAQIPAAGAAGTSVTLSVTASVPTLLSWTPPSASGTVAVVAPPKPSSSSSAPAPRVSSSGSGSGSGSGPHASPSGSAGGSPAPPVTVGDPGAVGFTGTFPPQQLPELGTAVQGAGSAAGLFPTIGPSPTPDPGSGQTAAGAVAVDYASGMPLAPTGLIVGLVLAAAGMGLAAPGMYRRRRSAAGHGGPRLQRRGGQVPVRPDGGGEQEDA